MINKHYSISFEATNEKNEVISTFLGLRIPINLINKIKVNKDINEAISVYSNWVIENNNLYYMHNNPNRSKTIGELHVELLSSWVSRWSDMKISFNV